MNRIALRNVLLVNEVVQCHCYKNRLDVLYLRIVQAMKRTDAEKENVTFEIHKITTQHSDSDFTFVYSH